MWKFHNMVCLVVFALVSALNGGATAQSISTDYDMTRMLNEPHPLAGQMGTRWQPAVPATTSLPVINTKLGKPRPVVTPIGITITAPHTPQPVRKGAKVSEGEPKRYGWLSEFRVGAFKHAFPITGNTSKETGVDANLEVLFGSPGWMKILGSPRPHLGASFNASSTNTDFVYTGLTWEWRPWRSLFIDASFGIAAHNGNLKNDPTVSFPPDAGRQRELGCRALFRESIEMGVMAAEHHSLSAIWDHLSNGGICGEQNEGLDNVGIRYGYRF